MQTERYTMRIQPGTLAGRPTQSIYVRDGKGRLLGYAYATNDEELHAALVELENDFPNLEATP